MLLNTPALQKSWVGGLGSLFLESLAGQYPFFSQSEVLLFLSWVLLFLTYYVQFS